MAIFTSHSPSKVMFIYTHWTEKRGFFFFFLPRPRQWEGYPSKARPTEMQLDAAEPRISSPVLMSVLKPDHTAVLLLLNVTSPPVPFASRPPPALSPSGPSSLSSPAPAATDSHYSCW